MFCTSVRLGRKCLVTDRHTTVGGWVSVLVQHCWMCDKTDRWMFTDTSDAIVIAKGAPRCPDQWAVIKSDGRPDFIFSRQATRITGVHITQWTVLYEVRLGSSWGNENIQDIQPKMRFIEKCFSNDLEGNMLPAHVQQIKLWSRSAPSPYVFLYCTVALTSQR